jgi:uncharacterized protein involved in outer membrane biogenesis
MADADLQADGTDAAPIDSPRQRAGPLKIALRVVLGLLALIFLAWLVLYITKGRFLKSTFESYASRSAQREIKVAGDFQLYFDPITIKFLADGMTVSNPAWRGGQFFKSKHIETRIATFPLIFGTQRAKMLDLVDGQFDLAWDAGRRRNTFTFGDPNKPGKKFELPDIVQAQVVGTRIAYLDPLLQLKTDIKVETFKARDTRFTSDIRFTGIGAMRAKPFTMTGSLLSPNATLGGGENRLTLSARSGATVLGVSGTLPGATVLEGAKLKLVLRGPNFADAVAFLGAVVPQTRTYRATSNLTKTGENWRFTQIRGRFGASDIAGLLTISMPNQRLLFNADISTQMLDMIDAGPFIGYDPARLAAGKVAETVGGTPRLLPDGSLDIEALKRFDAHVDYKIAQVRAPNLPVSDIALTLDLQRSLMKLSPLTMSVAGGRLASDITINARALPVGTTYDLRLAPTPMGTLLARFGVDQAGTTGTVKARAELTGVGDSVRKSLASSSGRIAIILPRGSFWTRNVQLSELDIGTFVQKMFEKKLKEPVQINCGLIGFTVRNGVAAADPILIDTQKNVMVARGGFSFRNEAIDLAFRADSKKFSLFAGQSPVAINGYFAKPGIDPVSPELLSRAGVGLGLAIFASPLAGVLAFVDVGDAKSTQCGPVLAGATARAQRTTKGAPRDDVGRGTTAKAEDGNKTRGERKDQRKKFLGVF